MLCEKCSKKLFGKKDYMRVIPAFTCQECGENFKKITPIGFEDYPQKKKEKMQRNLVSDLFCSNCSGKLLRCQHCGEYLDDALGFKKPISECTPVEGFHVGYMNGINTFLSYLSLVYLCDYNAIQVDDLPIGGTKEIKFFNEDVDALLRAESVAETMCTLDDIMYRYQPFREASQFLMTKRSREDISSLNSNDGNKALHDHCVDLNNHIIDLAFRSMEQRKAPHVFAISRTYPEYDSYADENEEVILVHANGYSSFDLLNIAAGLWFYIEDRVKNPETVRLTSDMLVYVLINYFDCTPAADDEEMQFCLHYGGDSLEYLVDIDIPTNDEEFNFLEDRRQSPFVVERLKQTVHEKLNGTELLDKLVRYFDDKKYDGSHPKEISAILRDY